MHLWGMLPRSFQARMLQCAAWPWFCHSNEARLKLHGDSRAAFDGLRPYCPLGSSCRQSLLPEQLAYDVQNSHLVAFRIHLLMLLL